jgi:hypothetical protein
VSAGPLLGAARSDEKRTIVVTVTADEVHQLDLVLTQAAHLWNEG